MPRSAPPGWAPACEPGARLIVIVERRRPQQRAEGEVEQDQRLVLVEPDVERADEDLDRQQAPRAPRPGAVSTPRRSDTTTSAITSSEARYMKARCVRWMSTSSRLAEGHELAVAGGELLAAGVVRAVAELVVGAPVVLRAGHVAAGHDRAEHGAVATMASAAQPRAAVDLARRRSTLRHDVDQEPEQQHREPEVRGDEASSRFSSTVAPPSAPCAITSTSSSEAAGQRGSGSAARRARTATGS